MKIAVEATELKDGKIKFLSLVKHGANQTPFEILKSKDGGVMTNLIDGLNKMFHKTDDEDRAKVAALFVSKGADEKVLKRITDAGFSLEDKVENDNMVMFKQGCFDEQNLGSLVSVTDHLGIMLDRVVKDFTSFPGTKDFDTNVQAAAFFPALHNAMESLAETVWFVLNDAGGQGEASAEVDKVVEAFAAHIKALVRNLPEAVFKMEFAGLQDEFEGGKLSKSDESEKKDKIMKTKLNEAVAGDLEGLLDAPEAVEKTDEQLAAEAKLVETAAAAEAGTVDTGVEKGHKTPDDDAPKILTKAVKVRVDGKTVEKNLQYTKDDDGNEIFIGFEKADGGAEASASADETPASSSFEKTFAESMAIVAKAFKDLQGVVEKQGERIEAVAKTATSAEDKAGKTVVLTEGGSLDESLATLQGHKPVVKSKTANSDVNGQSGDIFKGLIPEFDNMEEAARN